MPTDDIDSNLSLGISQTWLCLETPSLSSFETRLAEVYPSEVFVSSNWAMTGTVSIWWLIKVEIPIQVVSDECLVLRLTTNVECRGNKGCKDCGCGLEKTFECYFQIHTSSQLKPHPHQLPIALPTHSSPLLILPLNLSCSHENGCLGLHSVVLRPSAQIYSQRHVSSIFVFAC